MFTLVRCIRAFGLVAVLLAGLAKAAQPVRVVATGGRIGNAFYPLPAGGTEFRQRSPHVLGGPVAEIQVGFMDWVYSQNSGELANTLNDVTLTHVWLERASTGQIVPITFSGARPLVLLKSSTTPVRLSDVVPSSVWTGAAPARDEVFWLHVRGSVPAGGQVPAGTPTSFAGASFVAYPVANDPGAADTAGAIPAIAGGTTRAEGLPLIFLGRYTGPGPLAVMGIGDSIMHGTGDNVNPAATIAGFGFFNRAALDANGKNTIATFNVSRYAQTAQNWINPTRQTRQTPLLQYANVVVEEYGTNDLGSTGTGDPTVILQRLETIWSTARARGVQKIVRTLLQPRTTTTDQWRTLANQTPATGWESGGKRDTINAGLRAALTAGKIDHLVDTLAVLGAPTDPSRWVVNNTVGHATSDGTHISPNGNALLAAALRSALLAQSVDDYPAWLAAKSWNGADSSSSADPDRDGLPNLLEYALDTDPLAVATQAPFQVSTTTEDASARLRLTFLRACWDLDYEVEVSSTLAPGSWSVIATNPGQVGQEVTVVDTEPVSATSRRFIRIRVTAVR